MHPHPIHVSIPNPNPNPNPHLHPLVLRAHTTTRRRYRVGTPSGSRSSPLLWHHQRHHDHHERGACRVLFPSPASQHAPRNLVRSRAISRNLVRPSPVAGCGTLAKEPFEQASPLLDRLEAIKAELSSISLVAEELLHCRHLCGEGAAVLRHLDTAVDECQLRVLLSNALCDWQTVEQRWTEPMFSTVNVEQLAAETSDFVHRLRGIKRFRKARILKRRDPLQTDRSGARGSLRKTSLTQRMGQSRADLDSPTMRRKSIAAAEAAKGAAQRGSRRKSAKEAKTAEEEAEEELALLQEEAARAGQAGQRRSIGRCAPRRRRYIRYVVRSSLGRVDGTRYATTRGGTRVTAALTADRLVAPFIAPISP